jgi:hypothetical protein
VGSIHHVWLAAGLFYYTVDQYLNSSVFFIDYCSHSVCSNLCTTITHQIFLKKSVNQRTTILTYCVHFWLHPVKSLFHYFAVNLVT